MLIYRKITDSKDRDKIRRDYLHTLSAPIDGWWENTAIASAAFWQIDDEEQQVGFFCMNDENVLLRFQVLPTSLSIMQDIFRQVVADYTIRSAIASSMEMPYFSLCSALQTRSEVHSLLFRDDRRMLPPATLFFRKAAQEELHELARFYRANVEGAGDWIEAFLRKRLQRQELHVLYDQQTLLATGECIPSQDQQPYADLGMVVARAHRSRGLGSSMLLYLKQYCYEAGWRPICSCAAENIASQKAIEKAGFVSEERMMKISFS